MQRGGPESPSITEKSIVFLAKFDYFYCHVAKKALICPQIFFMEMKVWYVYIIWWKL